MRAAAARDIPALARRRAHLATLERIVREHARAIAQTVAADFGQRSAHETELLEIYPTLEAARYARRHLATWMKPEAVAIAPHFWPARARIVRRPLGVVGIIAAWNYPLLLAFGPLAGALAAGNRAPAPWKPPRRSRRCRSTICFGPILAARTYRTLDEAIAYVNARPHPLALYYFGANSADIARVLEETTSGGACINDVMLQFPQDGLPFGGVGPSGMGAYHGRAGFETFSHRKAVFEQAKFSGYALLEPPYGRRFKAILRLLQR
jgi:acyl-CoA reductase-like NAD-dependent aldehyde dehydrogenase